MKNKHTKSRWPSLVSWSDVDVVLCCVLVDVVVGRGCDGGGGVVATDAAVCYNIINL